MLIFNKNNFIQFEKHTLRVKNTDAHTSSDSL